MGAVKKWQSRFLTNSRKYPNWVYGQARENGYLLWTLQREGEAVV